MANVLRRKLWPVEQHGGRPRSVGQRLGMFERMFRGDDKVNVWQWMTRERGRLCVIGVLLVMAVACTESHFSLASQERLPAWFLPAPAPRNHLSVTLSYYSGISGRRARLELWNEKRDRIRQVDLVLRGRAPLSLAPGSATGERALPTYEVATAHGIAEILVHKAREPVFYINDDPVVREKIMRAAQP